MKIVKKGFRPYESKGNVVTIGQPTVLNATLHVGAITETMVVNAAAELVQTATSGNIGNLFDNVYVKNLPIVGAQGRNPLTLVELQPGVVDSGGFGQGGPNVAGGGVHVDGARDRAWNFTLDGIDINETSAGGSNFSPLRTMLTCWPSFALSPAVRPPNMAATAALRSRWSPTRVPTLSTVLQLFCIRHPG